jgi:DNA-binding MarR family transcriptional regulator
MGLNCKIGDCLNSRDLEQIRALISAIRPMADRISLPQLVALLIIGSEPGLSVNELAEKLDVPQQTASRYASYLMGRYESPAYGPLPEALLTQEINPSDPRSRSLQLTEAGMALVHSILTTLKPGAVKRRTKNVSG